MSEQGCDRMPPPGHESAHRLVTIGDSLTHGFMSGAIFRTDLSWPAIVASELGLSAEQFAFPTYELPPALQALDPVPTTHFLRSGPQGRTDGGLFSLDGVHPTTIGHGLLAQEVIRVMEGAGVVFRLPDGTARSSPVEVDVDRLVRADTLVRDPPSAVSPTLSLLGRLDERGDGSFPRHTARGENAPTRTLTPRGAAGPRSARPGRLDRQTRRGTLPNQVSSTHMALCAPSAVGSNISGQPPSITVTPCSRP